ncbi:hypothetical protein Taro_027154 [Colocasia esculenta]|uniref:Uncharacterized protein n=1 Tax=Colocasia esculenta TaxID=4460 RepID=A0A843VDS8_COLES|nr:hypothetical protein [Colocasia esculenta]
MSTVRVCVVFLDTLTSEFKLYIRLREILQGAGTRVCGCAVACSMLLLRPTAVWSEGVVLVVSTVLDPAEVERQLNLLSVDARLRGRLVLFVWVCGWCHELVLVTRGSCPTELVTCEAHPFLFQVKESRRVPIPLLVLGYNQLVDHVGIHGQRRLTEALNKDSLVRQKEYPTKSSSKSRESVSLVVLSLALLLLLGLVPLHAVLPAEAWDNP